jgi:hypothetical protein
MLTAPQQISATSPRARGRVGIMPFLVFVQDIVSLTPPQTAPAPLPSI